MRKTGLVLCLLCLLSLPLLPEAKNTVICRLCNDELDPEECFRHNCPEMGKRSNKNDDEAKPKEGELVHDILKNLNPDDIIKKT